MKKNLFVTFVIFFSGTILLANSTVNLNEVTVTANKMDENIKEIPQSISSLDEYEIEQKQIQNIPDVIKYIPNLSSTYMYSDRVNFRGINTSVFTNNNPIVIYIDGIPQSSVYDFDASLLNIKSVEVLRGPQGVLYGKDSIGGVINITTKEATNELEGYLGAEYGSMQFMQTSLDINGPIIKDKLYFGINAALSKDDGWQTNHNSSQDNDSNRKSFNQLNANLYYKANDDLSINLNVFNNEKKRYGFQGGAVSQSEDINSYNYDDFKDVNFETDSYIKTKAHAQSLKIEYFLDNNTTFTSVTANKNIDIDGKWDVDYGSNSAYDNLAMFQDAQSKDFSQEFRIVGENETFRYVTGLYFERDEFKFNKYGMEYPSYLVGNPFGSGVAAEFNSASKAIGKTYAAFGQVVIPFLETYELTLGARYQSIHKSMNLDYYFNPINTSSSPIFNFNEDNKWNAFLPKIAISKKINEDLSTYINISKGYLPGGYNNFASSGTEKDNRFDAQTSMNYEIGMRGSFFNDKLYLSSSIFYMDINDIHVYSTDPTTKMMYTSNAGEATSKGIELEANYNINSNWKIDASIGLIQAKYTKYIDANEQDNKNKKIERTPSHSINLGVSYYADNGFYGRVDIRNQGKMYFNAQNSLKQDAYTIGNIKLGYLFKNLDIYSYVKNITDESYIEAVEEMAEYRQLSYGEGRIVGIGLKYTF